MSANRSQKTDAMSVILIVFFVIAVLGILAGLLLPSLAKAKAKGKRSQPFVSMRYDQLDLAAPVRYPSESFNTESYDRIVDNPFLQVIHNPLSTFSIDVDTASYSNIRRFLSERTLPPKDAVRIEEMLNYFTYSYPPPRDEHPFAVHVELGKCPWNPMHRLARIGMKGREIAPAKRPACNLVFLIDVSGSMAPANKLPLLLEGLELLVEKLSDADRVAIVVYAGSSGLVLESTSAADKERIVSALRALRAGGSTNGGQGIDLAYRIAMENFIRGGANRVILCTDGDFNVGVTSPGDLTRMIQQKARTGVYLTVLGFGMGNYKDGTLEKLADLGNGNYGYIDTLAEAKKILVEQLSGTLVTIAKDVKIQVEFNPALASAYRLIGYENRLLRREDFNDDTKDAGEIGSGHTVTALYEIVPAGSVGPGVAVDDLKYQTPSATLPDSKGELMTVKVRYKLPDGESSTGMNIAIVDSPTSGQQRSKDFVFAAGVAVFGLVLRDADHRGHSTLSLALQLASEGQDGSVYREEFLGLVRSAVAIRQFASGTRVD